MSLEKHAVLTPVSVSYSQMKMTVKPKQHWIPEMMAVVGQSKEEVMLLQQRKKLERSLKREQQEDLTLWHLLNSHRKSRLDRPLGDDDVLMIRVLYFFDLPKQFPEPT